MPIEFIKASNERDAKFKRIIWARADASRRQNLVVEGISHQIELENEVEFFPRARRDGDIIDAISYIQHFIIGKDYRKERTTATKTPMVEVTEQMISKSQKDFASWRKARQNRS